MIAAGKAGLITGMMNTGSALASIVAPGVTGYMAMGFGWTAALGLGSVLAFLSAIIMFLTAPKDLKGAERKNER